MRPFIITVTWLLAAGYTEFTEVTDDVGRVALTILAVVWLVWAMRKVDR